ncbi:E3 ubiquitin-protein ligase ATL4-like [Bidens hawaiensis]|uniref:E3 ubiquitin-protein ligase ATL4-like n=1 Tax=Bidens hawaiensis TaxID=980011 RepID=UPI004049EC8E
MGEIVGTLINRFETLVNKMRSAGIVYDQSEINDKLLNSLPCTWNSSVITIKRITNLDRTLLFDLTSTIRSFEMDDKLILERHNKDHFGISGDGGGGGCRTEHVPLGVSSSNCSEPVIHTLNTETSNGIAATSSEKTISPPRWWKKCGKFDGGGDCAVCLSKFHGADLLRLLPLCCHAFHAECIDTWLKSNQTCPLCRSSVNPNESDIMNALGGSNNNSRSGSFRIEIGTISQRRDPANSDRRSYSVGSFDYVLDDGYEIPVESTHRSVASDCTDKDSVTPEPPGEYLAAEVAAAGGSGRFNWLRDYVDRVSTSLRGSGRFFTGSSRRSENVNEFETSHGSIGEEISELFRWLSGV